MALFATVQPGVWFYFFLTPSQGTAIGPATEFLRTIMLLKTRLIQNEKDKMKKKKKQKKK